MIGIWITDKFWEWIQLDLNKPIPDFIMKIYDPFLENPSNMKKLSVLNDSGNPLSMKLAERSDQINQLGEKTERVAIESKKFNKNATELHQMLKKKRWYQL